MITENDLHRGRELARQNKVTSIEEARESMTPAIELLGALSLSFVAVVALILTLAYKDQIDAFCVSVVKAIWL